MEAGCPCCGGPPAIGVLCAACRETVPPCDGLVPGHVSSRASAATAQAWLIDGFGAPHAIGERAVIGRRPEADLVVLNDSVSRDHAELSRGEHGWTVRDLGSRNGTTIDGRRVQARALIVDGARLRVGEVAFAFVGRAIAMPDRGLRSLDTRHAGRGPFRFTLRGGVVDLCLVGGGDDGDDGGGALLYRSSGAAWSEVSLPPLEFQLLRMLCTRALADHGSPSRARGCVPTKQLAKQLPFQSKYANEENVRQVVRRVRTSLGDIGAGGLLEAQPGRGYYLAWPVDAG